MLETSLYAPVVFTRLELHLEALDPIPLLGFPGTALRGMLGVALRNASCDASGRPAFEGPCLYRDIFEPPRPLPGEQSLPPPYVLHPPTGPVQKLAPGDSLHFGLTLFGAAAERTPALLWALFRHGLTRGLSREHRRFLLTRAEAVVPGGQVSLFHHDGGPVIETWDPRWNWTGAQVVQARLEDIAPAPEAIELRLTTPLDLREQGHAVEVLEFSHIVRSLLRNVSAHAWFHGSSGLELDFRAVKDAAFSVRKVADRTDWLRIEHDSSRQGRTIPVQTRVGSLTFEGDLSPFLPLLSLGTALHLGKGRTMGFGGMDWRPIPRA